MNIRKIIFWFHLCCGIVASLVILMMSFTGILLTYERQIIAWSDSTGMDSVKADNERESLDELIKTVKDYNGGNSPSSISVPAGPVKPVTALLGREKVLFLDPYTNTVIGEGSHGARKFFSTVTRWHRWFNVSGESRSVARAITGISNVIFLILILSGMYLWLPGTWKSSHLRVRLFFKPDTTTAKARDFNRHHVYGIWACIPLMIVVSTATVFSYRPVSNMVYRVYGETPPVRGRNSGVEENILRPVTGDAEEKQKLLSIDELYNLVNSRVSDWNSISFRVNDDPYLPVTFTIDAGNGGQPHKQSRITLDRYTGMVLDNESFADQSPGRRTRSIIRRLHTGELLGVTGQTIAGIVSFAGAVLVWTGLALAFRRLVLPFFRKRTTKNRVL